MRTKKNPKKRTIWLDYLRAFACFLVAVGHLLKSMPNAGIMEENWLLSGFVQVSYHFHVALFFFASGYLFQRSSERCATLMEYGRRKFLRLVDLVIPYIIFSVINYVIKVIVGDSVNDAVTTSLWETLLLSPIAQMWFLYALAMVTLVTPAMRSNKGCVALIAAAVAVKVIGMFPALRLVDATNYILWHELWYVAGMLWAFKGIRMNWLWTLLSAVAFAVVCAFEFIQGSLNGVLETAATLTGILMCVGFFQLVTEKRERLSPVWSILARYMMQIYLLHTIFAAGVRIVLMKLGVMNAPIHLMLGFAASFVGPVICAWIAERTKVLNFVFFPSKTISAMTRK